MLKKKKMFLNNQLEGVHGLGGEIFSIQLSPTHHDGRFFLWMWLEING